MNLKPKKTKYKNKKEIIRNKLIIGKKGNVLNIPIIMGILFITVLGLIFGAFIFNRFDQITQEQGVFKSVNASVQAVGNVRQTFINLDAITFWIFLGFTLFLIISAYLIRTSPIFTVFLIIFVVICEIMAFIISNSYYEISNTSELTNTTISYPITNNIMNNLPLYVGIVGFLTLITLFAKPGGQQV